MTKLAFHGKRQVYRNMSIAGMKVDVGGKIRGDFQIHTAVGSPHVPRLGDAGTRLGLQRNATVARRNIDAAQTARDTNRSIPGVGTDAALYVLDFQTAIAAVEIHVAAQMIYRDVTVARAQRNLGLAGHLNLDRDPAPACVEHEASTRQSDFNFHRVTILTFNDLHAVFADFPALGVDVRCDLVLVPGVNADIG